MPTNIGIVDAANLSRLMRNLSNRLLGILLLVATAPTMVLVALAVRLESGGPIFQRYMRTDRSGRTFEAWAFRVYMASPNPATFPPHFTAIGRLLWWSRLDELPVLISVAGGTARISLTRDSKSGSGTGFEIVAAE